MSRAKTFLLCTLILLVAAVLVVITFQTEPTAQRGGTRLETAMLVDVTLATRGSFRPVIDATGVVRPVRDVPLRSQVSGAIVALAPEFVPGGFVDAGRMLLRIEPADYRNVVRQRRSALGQAEAELTIEMGRQQVAKKEFALLGKTMADTNEARILRKPQLEAARVAVESARAALDQAELDLSRTTVKAPFAAQVVRRNVNVGSQVSSADSLGRLVGVETYWVEVTAPLPKLRWITVPSDPGGKGSEVVIRNRTAWPEGVTRPGRVFSLVGALDDQTRMARVLISVSDPLVRKAETQGPPLIVGEFVEVRIQGNQIDDAIRLERDYVRDRDTVWLFEDGKLRITPVKVAVRDTHYAFVTGGLEEGARVVTTNLATVVDGARLRVRDEERSGD